MRRVLPLLVFGLLASPAAAATVEVEERRGQFASSARVVFRGEGDEVNDVRYSVAEGGRYAVLRDAAAEVRAGRGCESVDAHTARCATDLPPPQGAPPYVVSVTIELRGGDDVAAGEDVARLSVDGGAGADQLFAGYARSSALSGGEGDDRVIGGVGPDGLSGGPGADLLSGGPGDDALLGDPADGPFAADVMDGGGGEGDSVAYGERLVPVRVDLAAVRGNGVAGEDDSIEGVEVVDGGLANDTLLGNDARNVINGGGGSNVLIGRGGDDLLVGSEGTDTISGDAGNDTVEGAGGADLVSGGDGDDALGLGGFTSDPFDRAECGAGRDGVRSVDVRDLVRADCERVEVLGLLVAPPRAVRRGFAVRLRPSAHPVPCPVAVTVTTRRRAVRSRAVRVRSSVVVRARRRVPVRRRPAPRRVRVELRGVGCGGVGGFVLAVD